MICVCWRSNLYVLCVFSFSEIECLFCTEYLSISPSSRRAATAAERSTTALLSFVNSRGWWQMAGRSPFRFCSLRHFCWEKGMLLGSLARCQPKRPLTFHLNDLLSWMRFWLKYKYLISLFLLHSKYAVHLLSHLWQMTLFISNIR